MGDALLELSESFRAAVSLAEQALKRDRTALASLLERSWSLASLQAASGRQGPDAEESAALSALLQLSETEIKSLSKALRRACKRAVDLRAQSEALAERFTAAGGSAQLAALVSEVWRERSPALLASRAEQERETPDKLLGVQWRVSVPIAAGGSGRGVGAEAPLLQPVTTLELALKGGKAGEKKSLVFQATQEQLAGLFESLEKVQLQLDALADG